MVKHKLMFVLGALTILSVACDKKEEQTSTTSTNVTIADVIDNPKKVETSIATYKMALQNNDASVAIHSLYQILASEPNNLDVQDSLSMLYFSTGQLVPAYNIVTRIIEERPADARLLEAKARILQQAGDGAHALASFQAVYAITKNPAIGYEISALQMNLNKMGEAQGTALALLQDEKSLQEFAVEIMVNEREGQRVPVNAALMNLLGVIYQQLNNKDQAEMAFQGAVQRFPEFALAKNNLAALNS